MIREDPKLHLVWYSDTIYIKPIPQCLLNFEFWRTFLCNPQHAKVSDAASHHTRSARGFLRTYTENGGLQEICVEVIEMTKDTEGGLDDDGEAYEEAHWASKGKVPGHKAGGLYVGKATTH